NFLTQSAFALAVRIWYPPATSTRRTPRLLLSSSACNSLMTDCNSSLLTPLITSPKRCRVSGPSDTNSKLSITDLISSRSMPLFLGFWQSHVCHPFVGADGCFDHNGTVQ